MGFFFFILVNAMLFIRPAEVVPALLGVELYFYCILGAFVFGFSDILGYLTGRSIESHPITISVFGILIAILIPPMLMGDAPEAWRCGWTFAKIVVYYVLFVSLVNTPTRLRVLLLCIACFCAAAVSLAVMQYQGFIKLDTLEFAKEFADGRYGEQIEIVRLQGTGAFRDPNELCVLMATVIPICLFFISSSTNLAIRAICLACMPLYGYAIYLTHSRGGFLALVSGLGSLAAVRFGWRRTILIAMLALPILFVLFRGRQTEISTSAGTGKARVELWREWITTFVENPIFGKGAPMPKEDDQKKKKKNSFEPTKHLAHNSYLQSFADIGFFGGCLFIGAWVISLWSIYRCRPDQCLIVDPLTRRMQPFVMAMLVAYAVGMLSLSINFIVATYMMLALGATYPELARRNSLSPAPALKFDVPMMGRYATVGVAFLVSIYVFVRFVA